MAKSSYEELAESLSALPDAVETLNTKARTTTAASESTEEKSVRVQNKYFYQFGLDSITFSQLSVNENMCFISEDIEVGALEDNEYLQLTADYETGENGSIEFYLIDGANTLPILPVGSDKVINEKVFYGLGTRFSIDTSEEVVVMKNGTIADVTFDQAKESNQSGYTVTYHPLDAYNVKTENEEIRLKVILRTYDINGNAPVVKSMAIRKYGRSSVWKSDTIN